MLSQEFDHIFGSPLLRITEFFELLTFKVEDTLNRFSGLPLTE